MSVRRNLTAALNACLPTLRTSIGMHQKLITPIPIAIAVLHTIQSSMR